MSLSLTCFLLFFFCAPPPFYQCTLWYYTYGCLYPVCCVHLNLMSFHPLLFHCSDIYICSTCQLRSGSLDRFLLAVATILVGPQRALIKTQWFKHVGSFSDNPFKVLTTIIKGSNVFFLYLSALDAPKDLTVAQVTETTMMLEWKSPLAKLDSFRLVYVSADGHRAEEVVPGSSESHTLRSLTPGMLYTISITAERGRRTSAPATISAPTGQNCNKHTPSKAMFPTKPQCKSEVKEGGSLLC